MGWSEDHAHVHQTLRRPSAQGEWLIPSGSRVLVAVSGGQDSMTLLALLRDLQPHWAWQLWAVHCNHRWRADSDRNAQFVMDICQRWQIPAETVTAETPPPGEAAARAWRYQVFAEAAAAHRCTVVVTGHTASDRAETLLYNLIRGSGAEGLQALGWRRPLGEKTPDIALVRPLLNLTRAQTAAFCQTQSIPIWEDATNQDTAYARNRLRLAVLPLLRSQFNPQVEQTLAQTAELLSAEVAYLDAQAQDWGDRCVDPESGKIQRRVLQEAPLALQRRVLRRVLQGMMPSPPNFDQVEKLVALIPAPNRSQTDPFPGGAIARVEGDWIVFAPATPLY